MPALRPDRRRVALTVEALEDRCLLSAETTVPALTAGNIIPILENVYLASLPKGNPSIVFLGDSITWNFAHSSGASVWSAFWTPVGASEYGVSGQTTQTLLFQLSLGQLLGIHPSVVVLTIGINNLAGGDSPQATAAGVIADVQAIYAYQPAAQVIFQGLPPGADNPADPFRLVVEQTNNFVSQTLAADPRATFVDIAPAFERPDGTISNFALVAGIHPTTLGYLELTEVLAVPIAEAFVMSQFRVLARFE